MIFTFFLVHKNLKIFLIFVNSINKKMNLNIIPILFIIISLNKSLENLKTNQRKLEEFNDLNNNKIQKDNLTDNAKKIEFPETSNPKYLMIFLENCDLRAEYNYKTIQSTNNIIEISYSKNYTVNIKKVTESKFTCRFSYATYDEIGLELIESVNYNFNKYQNLTFSFVIENYTNPSYFININKSKEGQLKIKLNTTNKEKEIIINDINPYKQIYINRKNLFEECSNQEPYNCTFNIYIIGEDISFNLLIRNAHDNPIPSYFPPNQMIIGASEAFNILFYYTDVLSEQKGELFLSYKRGGNIVNSTIISYEDFSEQKNWDNKKDLNYDYINRKITFNLIDYSDLDCDKGCILLFGVYVGDYQIDEPGDFSFFLRFIESNDKSTVNIISNEYIYGILNSDESDLYRINIPYFSLSVNIYFNSEFCNYDIEEDISFIQKEFDDNGNVIKLYNFTQKYFTFRISPKFSNNSIYTFKIILNYNNKILIQQINSEFMEYCTIINEKTDFCYFAFPLKDYQNSSQISFYAFNEDYSLTLKSSSTLISKEIDFDNLSDDNLNFPNDSFDNLLIHNIEKREENRYIVIKVQSNCPGRVYFIYNIYPSYEKRFLVPNSVNLFHYNNNDKNKTTIILNEKSEIIEIYDFIPINKIGKYNISIFKNQTLQNETLVYNIIPNKENQSENVNIVYDGTEGDFLIKTKNYYHELNMKGNETLMYKIYDNNNENNESILICKKKPLDFSGYNVTNSFTIMNDGNYTLKYGYISEENLFPNLYESISNLNITSFLLGNITYDENLKIGNYSIYESELEELDISTYICINIIYKVINGSYIKIKFTERNFSIPIFINESLTVYSIKEKETKRAKIYKNKITGFSFLSKPNYYYYKIYFFLPPYFNIFLRSFQKESSFADYEKKQNDTFDIFKTRSFGKRKLHLIKLNKLHKGLIIYFYNNQKKRFLSEEESTLETLIKVENGEDFSNLNIYDIVSNELSIHTYDNLTKIISCYPLIDNEKKIYPNIKYILKMYPSDISEDKIDVLNEEEEAIKTLEEEKINEENNNIEFIIDNEDEKIKNKEIKILVTANFNDDEKINYQITKINMSSNQNYSYDIYYNGPYENNILTKKKKKKKKWWIALIVIGALIIIAGIIFAIVKFKRKNNNNLDNIEDKSSVNINIKPNTQNI